MRRFAWAVAAGSAALLGGLQHSAAAVDGAPASTVLTGTIRAGGKPLEGVAVSARGAGQTYTTSVYTDQQGEYVFPRLDAGKYHVWAQAVGYEAGRVEMPLNPSRRAKQDFTLKSVKDFTMQLSGSEWMAALPDDTLAHRRMKQLFNNTCTGCHQPHFALQNRLDEAGWRAVITAMETVTSSHSWAKQPNSVVKHFKDELAAYLAEMRGPGPSPMTFKLLPRPTGDATRVVITEYDIPPPETPEQFVAQDGSDWSEGSPSGFYALGLHDMAVDSTGNVWINHAVANKTRTYAKLDTKTGEVTNFKVPGGKDGFLRGSHGMTTGPDGIIWMNVFAGEPTDSDGTSGVGSLGRLDPRTGTFAMFAPPAGMDGVGGHLEVDGKGKLWAVTGRGALRFDPDTKQFTEFKSPTMMASQRAGTYGLGADADGNGWWAVITHDRVGVSDVKTGTASEIQFAPRQDMMELVTPADRDFFNTFGDASGANANIGFPWAQAPRRLGGDKNGHVMWVGNFWGQSLAEVDIHTKQVTYHAVPLPYSGPYDVEVDNNHVPFVTLRNADRVGKFDPKNGQWTIYLLPTLGTEARYITVDRTKGDVWLPYSRTSKAARLQFRTAEQIKAARE
jgi:streptogramin lyase